MKLNIYTDETFQDVAEVKECARMKIPYRTGQHVINLLSSLDMADNQAVLGAVLKSEEHLTSIVCATFGLSEEDLPYVDTMELYDLAKEIADFVVKKLADLGLAFGPAGNDPNAKQPATMD